MTAKSTIDLIEKTKIAAVLQQYVATTDNSDIRAIVIGDEVVASMKRKANPKDFRANLNQDGTGEPIELTKQQKLICINAAKSVGLTCSGVDVMIGSTSTYKNKNLYVIEINGNFGFGIQNCTGVNIAEKMVDYAIKSYYNRPKNQFKLSKGGILKDGSENRKPSNIFGKTILVVGSILSGVLIGLKIKR